MSAKIWIIYLIEIAVFGALLFSAAGTLRWPAAWAFLAWFFVITAPMGVMLARHDPALFAERLKSPIQKDQPLWDRILLPILFGLFVLWLPLMGLDAVRFRWSAMPVWLQVAGALLMLVSVVMMWRVFRENTFLAPVVKIQSERGHTVISTGPYAIVRHPLYAAALIFFPAIALMLGSWYGVLASLLLIAILVIRTVMEERELRRGLAGYTDYAARVRYRLVPGIW